MILMQLENRLDYKAYLVDNSGFVETGQSKAQNVEAFLDYAKGKGEAQGLLEEIAKAREAHRNTRGQAVGFYSIFKAKGLEWPHVIVPAVNYGHIPAAGDDTDLSEERRLFYGALTRTKRALELHVVKGRPPSIFMEGLSKLNEAAQATRRALATPPETWGAAEVLAVAEVYRYLSRYFVLWSGADAGEQKEIAEWVLAANRAWDLKSTTPLPRDLEARLLQRLTPSQAKIDACVQALGVAPKLAKQTSRPVKPTQRRVYQANRDGPLEPGTKVWHKQHGTGRVVARGTERIGEVVEVAFERGRTAKFVVAMAAFELLS